MLLGRGKWKLLLLPLSGCHFGISLPLSLYLRHGFCPESEQPDGNRVNHPFMYIRQKFFCELTYPSLYISLVIHLLKICTLLCYFEFDSNARLNWKLRYNQPYLCLQENININYDLKHISYNIKQKSRFSLSLRFGQ